MKQESKLIAQALKSRFGARKVSVKMGQGTARHYIDAKILIDKSYDCSCGPGLRCRVCGDRIQNTVDEARKIAYGVLQHAGLAFAKRYDDEGEESDCFSLKVTVKNNNA